jgi:AcrR family transcriptional regulator
MVSRTEAAAATRTALVRAASELLDQGGPEAVTLRAVGARAGVSRGAPYGHFENKELLLAEVAIGAWNRVADSAERIRTAAGSSASARLVDALLVLIELARQQPHVYALMFSTPADSAETSAASGRLQEQYLAIVGDVVGLENAPRYGALLMSSAHGIAGLELSGHLDKEAWSVDGELLVRMLVEAVEAVAPARTQ